MENEAVGIISKTYNYNKFSFIENNREIYKPNLRKIEKSMLKKQIITPILVDKDFKIIDGQHRFLICKTHNLPIYYIITTATIEDTKLLNSAGRSWTGLDIFLSDMKKYPEYQKVNELLFKKYPEIKKQVILQLINKGYTVDIRGKKININDDIIKEIDYILEKAIELKPICNFYNDRYFLFALKRVLNNKEFDFNSFKKNIVLFGNLFKKQLDTSNYLEMIEETYNYRKHYKLKLNYR